MLVRTLSETKTVDWGNGLSRRFLLKSDGVGYTLTDTLVRAGTRSLLHYPEHLEACYCIAGSGWVSDSRGRSHRIEPGTLYALDQHDPHALGEIHSIATTPNWTQTGLEHGGTDGFAVAGA